MNDRLNNIEWNDSSLRNTSKLHIYFRIDALNEMNSRFDNDQAYQNDSRLIHPAHWVQCVEMNEVNDDRNDDSDDDKNNEGNAETMILKGLKVQ